MNPVSLSIHVWPACEARGWHFSVRAKVPNKSGSYRKLTRTSPVIYSGADAALAAADRLIATMGWPAGIERTVIKS